MMRNRLQFESNCDVDHLYSETDGGASESIGIVFDDGTYIRIGFNLVGIYRSRHGYSGEERYLAGVSYDDAWNVNLREE